VIPDPPLTEIATIGAPSVRVRPGFVMLCAAPAWEATRSDAANTSNTFISELSHVPKALQLAFGKRI
jgi:hypothetical protein